MVKKVVLLFYMIFGVTFFIQSASAISLIDAVSNQDFGEVKWMVSNGSNVNKEDGRGVTALLVAVEKNNLKMTNLLLDLGANAKAVSKRGEFIGASPFGLPSKQ